MYNKYICTQIRQEQVTTMSDRNSSDYLNLDNFDESLDSREYRRRQPNRRGGSVTSSGRPPYDRRPPARKRRRNRRRIRNRIVIVLSFLLILTLLTTLIVIIVHGCSKKTPVATSTETKPPETTAAAPTAVTDPPARPAQTNVPVNELISTTNFIPSKPDDNNADGWVSGAIYVWNQNGFELFGGSESSSAYYAQTVNTLAGKLPGINCYSMIVPNHAEIGLPERLRETVPSNSQSDNIKAAYAAMDASVVKPLNAYNYLSQHCNEYIYFKSDHHWTGLGAYYAYSALADSLGMKKLSLDDCTEQKIEDFTGTLTDLASGLDTDTVSYWMFPYEVGMDITDANGAVNHYDSPYYEQEVSGTLSYGVFIYGDNPLTVMKSQSSEAEKGRKIAVIKESYGNAFVPYLTYNFEEVHVMDMRTFRSVSADNFPAYCQKNGITDVLFFNGIMSANNPDLIDSMSAQFN